MSPGTPVRGKGARTDRFLFLQIAFLVSGRALVTELHGFFLGFGTGLSLFLRKKKKEEAIGLLLSEIGNSGESARGAGGGTRTGDPCSWAPPAPLWPQLLHLRDGWVDYVCVWNAGWMAFKYRPLPEHPRPHGHACAGHRL